MILATTIDVPSNTDTPRVLTPGDKDGSSYSVILRPAADIMLFGIIGYRGNGGTDYPDPSDDSWPDWNDEGFQVAGGGVFSLEVGPNEMLFARDASGSGTTVDLIFSGIGQPKTTLHFD